MCYRFRGLYYADTPGQSGEVFIEWRVHLRLPRSSCILHRMRSSFGTLERRRLVRRQSSLNRAEDSGAATFLVGDVHNAVVSSGEGGGQGSNTWHFHRSATGHSSPNRDTRHCRHIKSEPLRLAFVALCESASGGRFSTLIVKRCFVPQCLLEVLYCFPNAVGIR